MRPWSTTTIFAAATGVLLVAGCTSSTEPYSVGGSGDGPSSEPPPEGAPEGPDGTVTPSNAPTYWADVKPIIDAKCLACHVDGGIAPMSLVEPENVEVWAHQIRRQVEARAMPPWLAGDGCNEYIADRSLDEPQIQTISDWVAGGVQMGDPADEGPPLAVESGEMSRIDMSLTMPERYTPVIEPDEYRCFVMDWPETAPKYITGIGVTPGNTGIVHHAIPYLVQPSQVESVKQRDDAEPGPGYECFGVAGFGFQWLTSWEPGGHGIDMPNGSGIYVEPGSAVVLQVHYNTLTSRGDDATTIDFALADQVPSSATTHTHLNPAWFVGGMPIPAGTPDVGFEYTSTIGGPFTIYWADLHMHALGSGGKLSVLHADGSEECLLRVDDWRFEYQETFLLRRPVVIQPTDRLRVECHFDNTAENQIIVDGGRLTPRDVNWGDGTTDEMCLGNFLIAP